MADSYQTRTNGGETEAQMPDDQCDPNTPKERAVQGDSLDLQGIPDSRNGDTRGDGWYVAEWDDVFWTVTEPPKPTIDLWRVAP
jgi:hypothetical protein